MRSRRTVAASALLVVPLLLVACSGDPAPAPSTDVVETTENSPVLESVDPEIEEPPVLSGAVMATGDLTITACPPGTGELTATGTVHNTGAEEADYLVVVSWLGADGGVLNSAWAEVENLAADGTQEWSAAADLGSDQSAGCTTRLTRGSLAAP